MTNYSLLIGGKAKILTRVYRDLEMADQLHEIILSSEPVDHKISRFKHFGGDGVEALKTCRKAGNLCFQSAKSEKDLERKQKLLQTAEKYLKDGIEIATVLKISGAHLAQLIYNLGVIKTHSSSESSVRQSALTDFCDAQQLLDKSTEATATLYAQIRHAIAKVLICMEEYDRAKTEAEDGIKAKPKDPGVLEALKKVKHLAERKLAKVGKK